MADHDEEDDPQNLLRSLPIDDSPERVDALWRQIMVYKAFAEGDLSEAKARRAQAEAAREKAERETVQATRQLGERLRADAERKLDEAEKLKAEADRTLQQAEDERRRAAETTREASEARERIVAEAKQKAQEILDKARMAAQQESTELRRQALKEIKAILGRIDMIRGATDEELETQRIFSNIAKARADSSSLLLEPQYESGESSNGRQSEPANEPMAQDDEARDKHQIPQQVAPALAQASPDSKPDTPEAPGTESSDQSSAGAKGREKKAGKR